MVNALVVTYGNRWNYLTRVVDYLTAQPYINKIVLIDNNSSYDIRSKLSQFPDKIILMQPGKNLGSAGGYNLGLRYLHENYIDQFIWLLDDDNLPETKALEMLLGQFRNIQTLTNDNFFALQCLRPDRGYLQAIANGKSVDMVLPVKNSFFGFHLFKLPGKMMRKLKFIKQVRQDKLIKIPFAPYGGLFFQAIILNKIGLPDERYYLYSDDFEFTNRITANGGCIYLISEAKVEDLEKSWIVQKQNFLRSRILDQDGYKSLLAARNATHFQSHYRVTDKFIFKMNKSIYLTYLFFISIVRRKGKQFKFLLTAIKEGELGIFDNGKYVVQDS